MAVIRVFVVEEDRGVLSSMSSMLETETDLKVVGEASSGAGLPEAVEKAKPHIVSVDSQVIDEVGTGLPGAIQGTSSHPALIMTSEKDDPQLFRRSLMLGARDHLVKPFEGTELAGAVRAVFEASGAGQTSRARVLGFLGCKGGAGTTTVTLSLAGAAVKKGMRTLVLDGNLSLGDDSFLMDAGTEATWIDWSKDCQRGDADPRKYLARSREGIDLLSAPQSPAQSELITPESVSRMFSALLDSFDLVLVDIPNSFNETVLELIEGVQEIYLVSEPTLAGVKNLRLIWELLEQLRFPHEKRAMVLNKVHRRDSETVKETGKNFPGLTALPLESDLERGCLRGLSPIRTSPRSAFSRKITSFLDQLLAAEGER